MINLTWSLRISLPDGPPRVIPWTQPVEAIDLIDVVVEAGGEAATEQTVQVQPGDAAQVSFLAITSTVYGADVTYTIASEDGGGATDEVALLGPQVYANGSPALFGRAPKYLRFKNKTDGSKAAIRIVVGRSATPGASGGAAPAGVRHRAPSHKAR